MKLSEIQGERAIEVIAELVEPMTEIASDEKLKEVFNIRPKEGEKPEEAAMRVIKAKVPYLIKDHKKEVVQIIGIIEGVDAEKLNIFEIIKCLFEIVSDKALIQLFSSAVLEETAPQSEDFSK